MDFEFSTRRLKRELSDEASILKAYGSRSTRLKLRLDVLARAPTLDDVPPFPPIRRHELDGKYAGHFSVVIADNWRIIFRPKDSPPPRREDGGIDLRKVTAITIVEIVDYH